MVYHLEDLLARRLRALFLNARVTYDIAEKVLEKVAPELGWDQQKQKEELESFRELASKYILDN